MALVEFDSVGKVFNRSAEEGQGNGDTSDVTVFSGLNTEIKEGEFVALLGPSGCGKSTLLNMVAGLTQPTHGEVLYRGQPITGVNTDVGYVTQHDSLLPWRTVRFNVALPLRIRKVPQPERDARVAEIIKAVGLEGFEDALPDALSGGMRSRVMIARTFVYEPRALLLDEPFAALDALMRLEMQEELLNLWLRTSATVLYVTHDIDEALAMADRILLFSRIPARIMAEYELTEDRPRSVRKSEHFGALYEKIWELLRPEIDEIAK